MTQPTAAEIEVIRERDAKQFKTTGSMQWCGGPDEVIAQLMADRRTLLSALGAVTAERDQLRSQVIAGVYDAASVGITLIKTEDGYRQGRDG